MRYGSVCSGIEAATVAWRQLGWEPAWFSEIEPFPCAVLAHHYPETPNLGDMTQLRESEVFQNADIDVLVGGTPCQSFSVAGLRKGLDDPRGNLALEFLALADLARPAWVVWENVPGVLSSNGGRDFGSFLGALGELGYGWAYRVLDAQYFGVAQRRRRVFVVGHIGDWRAAAAVLFERDSLSGNPAPSRETRQEPARCLTRGADSGSRYDGETENFVVHTLRGEGFDASEDGTGRGTPLVPVAHVDVMPTMLNGADTPAGNAARSGNTKDSYIVPMAVHGTQDPCVSDTAFALGRNSGQENAVTTLAIRGRGDSHQLETRTDGTANALLTPNGGRGGIGIGAIHYAQQVRRLTPLECERLQGFPDDYTRIPEKVYANRQVTRLRPADMWEPLPDGRWQLMAADGPRYKSLGNSMAVPVMRWIGERIKAVSEALDARGAA